VTPRAPQLGPNDPVTESTIGGNPATSVGGGDHASHRHQMAASDEQVRRRRRWTILVILCVGQLMIVLDATVVNVALPIIERQLHFSQASLAWVANAYFLTFGGLLMLAGRIGDLVGRTRLFLFGLASFVFASALCGLAPNGSILVAARFLQGATAAMVASMVLGILAPMFPEPRERTIALSVFAFVAIGGASLGLVVGGVITEFLSWHWIFFINVPVGLAALLVGSRLIERQAGLGWRSGADFLGALLVTTAPSAAVYGLIRAGDVGWTAPSTIASLVASVVLAFGFFIVESRVKTPLIPLNVLRRRSLASSAVVRSLLPTGGFALTFLGALYMQHVLRYSPLRTGLAFLPSSVVTGCISLALLPWLTQRFTLKSLSLVGLCLVTAGMLAMSTISVDSSYVTAVFPAMMLTGAGFGLVFMPTIGIAMSGASEKESGIASGVVNVSVQIGAAIGVALLATISASRTSDLVATGVPELNALVSGYRVAFLVGAGLTGVSFVLALFLLPPGDGLPSHDRRRQSGNRSRETT
jgi:EmrB/QacA subfamily drug resistance transporter